MICISTDAPDGTVVKLRNMDNAYIGTVRVNRWSQYLQRHSVVMGTSELFRLMDSEDDTYLVLDNYQEASQ